jgi:hypothetical protein
MPPPYKQRRHHYWTETYLFSDPKAEQETKTMRPELYTQVVLNRDIPDENLKQGDVAMFIDILTHPKGGEEGAILEVFNALGESIDIATVPISAIEPIRADHIPSVRIVEKA